MPQVALDCLAEQLAALDAGDPQYAVEAVERLLAAGRAAGASDIHLQPAPDALEVKFRLDGVLQTVARLPRGLGPNVVARLKVQAELLTYRTDVPQEGRIRPNGSDVEMRLSTFPALGGERAVVRFFGRSGRYERLEDLGLPADVLGGLGGLLGETSGAILISGPAGSGKTPPPTPVSASWRGATRKDAASSRWKTRSRWPCPEWPNRRSIPPPGWTWRPGCGSSCGKTPR